MSINKIETTLKESLAKAVISGNLKSEIDATKIVIEIPKDTKNGDYSSNIAMQLTRELRQNPRMIATAIIDNLDKETADERKANVMEVLANLVRYMEDNDGGTLTGFLEEVALMTDIDNYNEDSESVVMMTLHSAKGLEFDSVIIADENKCFSNDGNERFMYLASTRALHNLTIFEY